MLDENKWIAHRFLNSGVTTFKVDHETSHADESGYEGRRPTVGDGDESIAAVEIRLKSWGPASNDNNWYIHRIGAAASSGRWYLIDRCASGGTTTCPSTGSGYATINALATAKRLSMLDEITSDTTCPT